MAEKITLSLALIALVMILGIYVVIDNKISAIDSKVNQQIEKMSELEKKQRLNSQDVDFVMKLVIEQGAKE